MGRSPYRIEGKSRYRARGKPAYRRREELLTASLVKHVTAYSYRLYGTLLVFKRFRGVNCRHDAHPLSMTLLRT
jgi:hypothetical protein